MKLSSNEKIGIAIVALSAICIWIYKSKNTQVPTASGSKTNFNGWVNQTGLNFVDLANQIFNAENSCSADFGTVLSVYNQLRTSADLQALTSAFGNRTYQKCWIDHPTDAAFGTLNLSGGLLDFLNFNLSETEMAQITQIEANLSATASTDGSGANPFN